MLQNQIIKSYKKLPVSDILEKYNKSKIFVSSLIVVQKFYNTPGYSTKLFIETKEWFDTVVMPNQKRGLNIQGYMRLIAMIRK